MLTPLGAHRFSLVLAASALLGALAAPPAKAAQVQCRAWSTTQTQVFPVGSYFEDTSGTSSTDTWAVGINSNGNVIGHWDGRTWTSVNSNDPNTNLYDVAAVSPTDAWAVGDYGDPHGRFVIARVLHWDGTSWGVYPAPKGSAYAFLYAVSAESPTDVWAGGAYTDGNGTVHPLALHFDGSKWTQVATADAGQGSEFYAVYTISPDDAWGVGYEVPQTFEFQPLIEHWDGAAWSVVTAPTIEGDSNFLYDVSGTGADDVWAAGPLGGIGTPPLTLHWDGATWSVVPAAFRPNTSYTLLAIKAIAPDDAWAAGGWATLDLAQRGAAAEHWDGTAWRITRTPSPGTSSDFYGIDASSSTDVWAVGYLYDFSFDGHPMAQHSRGPCPG